MSARIYLAGIRLGGRITFFFIRRFVRLRKAQGSPNLERILDEIEKAYGRYKS